MSMYTKNAHANTTKTTQVQARSLAQGAKLVRVLNDPLAALSKTLAAALRAEFADIQARTGVSMPSLNITDFRGGDACAAGYTPHAGRFYPLLLTRCPTYERNDGTDETPRLVGVSKPFLSPKLRDHVLSAASGEASLVRSLLCRGVAINHLERRG